MKRCLITGCDGFIGSHLADFLLGKGLTVFGTVYHNPALVAPIKDRAHLLECDMRDKENVNAVVKEARADYVFHLAAQSLVIPSWEDAENTFRTNIFGTMYLFDGIRQTGMDPTTVVACSSSEYGMTYANEMPMKETQEFRPTSPYGVSKIATDYLSYLYGSVHRMRIIRIRPFNVTGPRKTQDATSDFARGIAEIEAGQRKNLLVGNLEPTRDILDVRDAIRAMWLLTEKGKSGEVYNICSGQGYRIKAVLEQMIALARAKVEIQPVSERLRPVDEPIYVGDNSRLRGLGWRPEILLSQTLSDTLDYWRAEVQKGRG